MNSITIITIVVVALLTLVIFWLTWIGYRSCIKMYKMEVEQGKHDKEIFNEFHAKKKNKGGWVGLVCSYAILLTLFGLFVVGIVYKANGGNFSINNQTVLVIKSGSMSDFYNEEIAEKYNYDTTLHFDVGDICVFENISNDTELVEGEVYGYRHKNIIITHRFEGYFNDVCEFRGDNNPISDGFVKRENVLYHYTGQKVPGIGAFVLYAQSWLGIWSIVSIIGVAISSEIVYHQIDKINKERDKNLMRTSTVSENKILKIKHVRKRLIRRGKKYEK